MGELDLTTLTDDELEVHARDLDARVAELRGQARAVAAELNARATKRKAEQIVDSLSPAQREAVTQTIAARGLAVDLSH